MSSSSEEEGEENHVEESEHLSNVPQKNIIVSILLSESTASLLKLSLPNLQDIVLQNSHSTLYSLKAITNIEECPSNSGSKRNIKDFFGFTKRNVIRKENENIQTEVAYMSNKYEDSDTSVEAYDDLHEEDLEEENAETEELTAHTHLVLEPARIYTRPLLAANTLAHQGKIKNEKNNIYISILDSQLTITSSGWVNFCRICHGGESIATLIAPCRCKGSIALTHLQCLEQWLKQSSYSRCELCQHRYKVVREPKYGVLWSIIVFLRHPGEHYKELLLDLVGFLVYTPTAIASTYLLMLLCDSISAKNNLQYSRSICAHVTAFSAVFGMAAIDFTYSSWLVLMMQSHIEAWKEWYQSNCSVRIILPERKQRRHYRRKIKSNTH